jgi:hypothetical protein
MHTLCARVHACAQLSGAYRKLASFVYPAWLLTRWLSLALMLVLIAVTQAAQVGGGALVDGWVGGRGWGSGGRALPSCWCS